MSARLTADQAESFRRDGFHFPIDVLDAAEARGALAAFRRYDTIAQRAGGFISIHRHFPKLHLVALWADALVHHPRILAAAESLLGPDLLVWGTQVFTRPARSGASLAWHQDAVYYGLRDIEEQSARVWLALTPANIANGTMRYARGSHRDGLLQHGVRGGDVADMMRGEEVVVEIDPDSEVVVEIDAGQASVHDMALAHCSGPNVTDADRVNVAIDYITPDVQPAGTDSALLVQGADRNEHFLAERRPAADFDSEAMRGFVQATTLRSRRLQSMLRTTRA
jgi:non-heme Fe2+,alpha-ketoglutarate-dependent halogenase